jgi:hypothetical protein
VVVPWPGLPDNPTRSPPTNAGRPPLRSLIGHTARVTSRIILDVDTGTDDAVALMVAALSPDIELVGATTVHGNTAVANCTENTLRVFDWIGLPGDPGP